VNRPAYTLIPSHVPDPSRTPGWAGVYRIATMGYEMVLAIVVTGALGLFADWLFRTRPVFVITGVILGTIVGFVRFLRDASAAMRKGPADDPGPPPGSSPP
jgi:F0F1-type ATP synthase assembly protein I